MRRILLTFVLVAGLAALGPGEAAAGTGGVIAGICATSSTTCGYNIGASNVLQSNGTSYFTVSSNTCTHAYPANDVYKENLPTPITSFSFVNWNASSNCNRVVLYPNATQGGAGAVNCYASGGTCTPGGTFQSISWHNR